MNNFILLTTARSGSTWLGTLIDSHPDAIMYGELFLPHEVPEKYQELRKHDPEKFFQFQSPIIRPWKTWDYLKHVFSHTPDKANGFKLMAWPFISHPEIIPYCNKHNIHVIYLHRDIEERVMSYAIAEQRNNFHNLEQNTDNKEKIELNVKRVQKLMQKQKRLEQLMLLMKKGISSPALYINYAQLEQNQNDTMNKVFEFLDLKPHTPQSGLHKSSSLPYAQRISNYDEVMKVF
ncbi:MAG: sulfotransferase [Alphaproteobacteria bacterium]|nr:sulfotransferase [Alphaproteobacteria bacterium]